MADIFISYAHGDEAKVEALAGALEDAGYSVWWDRKIVGGAEFAEVIERELNAAKAVIVAWSASGNKSPWVRDEATAAHKQKKMVPVAVDGHEPPMGFRQFQAIDISQWNDDPANAPFTSLLRSIDACIAGKAPDALLNGSQQRRWPGRFSKATALAATIVTLSMAVAMIIFLQRNNATLSERINAENTNTAEHSLLRPVLANSIAVLPFADRSSDPNDAFFASGIHDDLLTRLYKIAGIHVISRTSVMGYAGTDKKVPEIARELGVVAVMEGAVQRSGNRVRINVQLIDAASDTHLWAENYDRELTPENIFAVQTEIAEAVTAALKVVMSAAETEGLKRLPTDNLDAYEAVMKGRRELAKRTGESLEEAIENFKQAIELDPDYAAAYANIADSYILLWTYGTMSGSEASALAAPLAKKAIELDPSLGEAWASLAFASASVNVLVNLEERAILFERAIDLSPNYASAFHWYSIDKRRQGEFEDALSLIQKAAALDPLSPIINQNVASALWGLGRFDEAEAQLQFNVTMFPEFAQNYGAMATFQNRVRGRLDNAVRWLKKAIALNPESRRYNMELFYMYLLLEDLESAIPVRERLAAIAPEDRLIDLSSHHISLYERRYDDAVEAMQQVIEKSPHTPVFHGVFGFTLAVTGDAKAAKQAYETFMPDWAEENVTVSPGLYYAACSYAWTLMQTGEETKARDIARQTLVILNGVKRGQQFGRPTYSFDDVSCHVVLGDEEAALAAWREAVNAGQRWNWSWWLRHPALNGLRERSEFEESIAAIKADLAEQRANLELYSE